MKKNTFWGIALFLVLVGTASNSWALGIPGFPALNTAFGMISGFVIAIVEAYLVIQLIFALGQMHHGIQGAKDKVVWICVAIFLIPFVPSIAQYLYNLFFQSGASPATNVWNGQ